MEHLQEKHLTTTRNLHYRYYTSPTPTTTTTTAPNQPALLLLHGWPDSALLWQPLLPHLLPLPHRLIIPDLLGYGGTSKPTSVPLYNYRLMLQDLLEILHAEGVTTILPIGHDFGCWLIFKLQNLHPSLCVAAVHIGIAYAPPLSQRLDPATLIDTLNTLTTHQVGYPRYSYFHLFTSPRAPSLFARNPRSVWHVLHGDAEDWTKHIFCTPDAMQNFLASSSTDVPLKPYAQNAALYSEWHSNLQTPEDWEASFCWYNAFARESVQMEEDLRVGREKWVLERPVLSVMCRGDGVNPPETLEEAKQAGWLPQGREVVLECGHWCTYEAPEEV
ncbi:hypothetical protein BAUCODRAFT_96023, partial [Baudoinia panamericana UAMH 10762]